MEIFGLWIKRIWKNYANPPGSQRDATAPPGPHSEHQHGEKT